ncbi:MAG TPA: response regulator, partial [Parvularculaceae bacterium]|nr:response regulator [Parvularculaceae bacterium]
MDEQTAAANLPSDASLLIVDDDEAFRTRLGRAMEKRGFQTMLAAGVKEAVSIARNNPPAFAVVDLRLEDGDGLEVVN